MNVSELRPNSNDISGLNSGWPTTDGWLDFSLPVEMTWV